MKVCTKCGVEKSLTEFELDPRLKSGYRSSCKECHRAMQKKYYYANREDVLRRKREQRAQRRTNSPEREHRMKKNNHLQHQYGISLDEYDAMRIEQEFCCALCGVHEEELTTALHVDHCHDTGEIRSLLCTKCNIGLGHFNHNPELLEQAMHYMNESHIRATPDRENPSQEAV